MAGVNYWAVLVAAVVAFVMGGLWYSPILFGRAWAKLRGLNLSDSDAAKMRPAEILAELVRGLVVAVVLAGFVVHLGIVNWQGAIALGLAVWFGFQATSIVGSVIHEHYPIRLFAIHTGDALAKTLVMAVILGVWR